jgi:hypothetical protein
MDSSDRIAQESVKITKATKKKRRSPDMVWVCGSARAPNELSKHEITGGCSLALLIAPLAEDLALSSRLERQRQVEPKHNFAGTSIFAMTLFKRTQFFACERRKTGKTQ